MEPEVLKRLKSDGPKRVLSLCGGGIKGCTTLGFLAEIEKIVRERRKNPHATLSDYFDLIGGTSTGAIIAALLSLGKTVEEVTGHYLKLGPEVFSQKTFWGSVPFAEKLMTTWSPAPLEKHAKALFSEKTTLGSPLIKTGLCLVSKRADTFSTWPFINHPDGRYYKVNADIPLWKLIRASSAAPTYFAPIEVEFGKPGSPQVGPFIDGGVSMANNPALQLFLVATLQGFPFRWPTGADNLLLVSVGTGRSELRLNQQEVLDANNLYWARNVPELFMQDATDHNELMLQYLSQSPTARVIDREVGALRDDLLGGKPHLSYVRYNAVLGVKELASVGLSVTDEQLTSLRDMSAGQNAQQLHEIGKAFAAEQCSRDHFPAAFT